MKMYDKQLYANVEDLLVQSGTRRHCPIGCESALGNQDNVQGVDLFPKELARLEKSIVICNSGSTPIDLQ